MINAVNTVTNYYANDQVIYYLYQSSNFSTRLINTLQDKATVQVLDDQTIDQEEKFKKTSRLFTNRNPFSQGRVLDAMAIPGNTYFTRLFYSSMKKKNPDLHLFYYEDGIGPYIGAEVFEIRNKVDALIKKYNKYAIYRSQFEKSYVYEPSLVQDRVQTGELVRVPKLDKQNPATQLLKDLFASSGDQLKALSQTTYVFFDQPFGMDGTQIGEIDIYHQLRALFHQQGKKLLIKAHPRESLAKYGGEVEEIKVDVPWEIAMLQGYADQVVSVGINTTALFTSYLLFGEATQALSYVNLLDGEKVDSRTQQIIQNSQQMTQDFKQVMGDHLLAPQTAQELAADIQQLTN